MNRILYGALAGVIATALMTIAISIGERLGLLRTPPPTQITSNVESRVGLEREPPKPRFTADSVATHHAFGAVGGAVYVLTRPILPKSPVGSGLVFGGVVWGIAYLGVFPALRLYPWPDDDRHTRTAVMIAAHAVYGVTLAETERRLR